MSEIYPPQPQANFEHSLDSLASGAKRIDQTFGRFNLAFDKRKAEDFVIHGDNSAHARYLVTRFDPTTEKITKALSRGNIEHFPVIAVLGGNCVFEVPLNAKPLLGERLFYDHESSETYISDEELFGKVGKLWGDVYQATGCLPHETVLAHTGMKEFSEEGKMIFPIPPFDNCRKIEDVEDAAGIFESSIKEELQAGYPRASIGLIVEAAGIAFREE